MLVVDDGSTDGTKQLLARAFDDGIHYVKHIVNRGGGAALATGFEYIKRHATSLGWTYLVTFDADGQHNIDDMPKFMEAFDNDADLTVVFGSRFIEKTDSNVPFLRKMTLMGGRVFTRIISQVKLTDAHNGYRMFRVEALDSINLTMDGMEYASELIDQIHLAGFQYKEVPVNIHYDEYTLAK